MERKAYFKVCILSPDAAKGSNKVQNRVRKGFRPAAKRYGAASLLAYCSVGIQQAAKQVKTRTCGHGEINVWNKLSKRPAALYT